MSKRLTFGTPICLVILALLVGLFSLTANSQKAHAATASAMIPHGIAVMSTHQEWWCTPVSEHCRWLEVGFPVCTKTNFSILDGTTGEWHYPSSPQPYDIQNWICNYNGNHTQFGIRTRFANSHLDWMSHKWFLFY